MHTELNPLMYLMSTFLNPREDRIFRLGLNLLITEASKHSQTLLFNHSFQVRSKCKTLLILSKARVEIVYKINLEGLVTVINQSKQFIIISHLKMFQASLFSLILAKLCNKHHRILFNHRLLGALQM